MANAQRGEIEAEFDGQRFTLCLTLGALAELETEIGGQDILALAERFEGGRLSARDALKVIGAGLRGGGHDITNTEIAGFRTQGSAAGFVDIVARLLKATFSPLEEGAPEKKP